ncbi:MAG: phospholipid carrier-dependent glycosyltransferase [Candidatus Aureabacteria bacterium]|nr:phospholipid carrier-dependent glycosyltransferase [Candidatus Auribacterota bacterium]
MDTKVRRTLATTLNLLILIACVVLLRVIFVGGIEIRFGSFIPAIGKTRLSCTTLANPFLFLCALLVVRALLSRKSPLRRLREWLAGNKEAVLLSLLIAVIAGFPRLWDLHGSSLSPDELLWVDRGEKLVQALCAHHYKKATLHLGHPGVVPAVLIGISSRNLGYPGPDGEFKLMRPITAARFPIAMIGTATCLLLFLVGRHAYGNAVSFWAAVFLSLYPPHIALSRVAHIDSTLTLFVMLSLLCYLVSALKRARSWKIASAIFFGLALLTKSPALIIPVILLAWKAAVRLWDRRGTFRFWELGDLAWLGIGFAIYFSFFTKLWYTAEEINWARYGAWFPPLGKLVYVINSVGSLPWLQITCTIVAIAGGIFIYYRRSSRREGAQVQGIVRFILLAVLVVLLFFSFIQLFHRPMANELLHIAKASRIGAKGHLKYWMGMVVSRPPRWFYVSMLLACTPPVTLIIFIFGIVRAGGGVVRRERRWPSYLMGGMAPVIFIAVMTIGAKMGFRYIDPAIPFVCLLSGIGLNAMIDSLSGLRIVSRWASARALCELIAAVMIAVPFVIVMNNIAPEYSLYFNAMVGGPRGAATVLSFSHAEGTRQAVRWFKGKVREDDSIYVPGLGSEFDHCWEYDAPVPPCRVIINHTLPPHADWIVISLRDRQMKDMDKESELVSRTLSPVHTVNICGLGLVDIYKIQDAPAVTNQVYQPQDLRSNVGKRVEDAAASNRSAIKGSAGTRGGFLLHGPYIRYAPGNWKAIFRIKTGPASGDAVVARLSVTGISRSDAICSKNVRAADMGTEGAYMEIPLDFSIEKPRRLQFCVEALGVTDLYVDCIKTERR